MTRQNRELSIDDNITYVTNVARQVLEGSPGAAIVWAGFSQGVAMAFRAAAFVDPIPAGVIACGGDIPPELREDQLRRIPAVLIGRGLQDEWYTFRANPRASVRVLMSLDESSYGVGDLAMGDHPIAWYHEFEGGRAWYTALGHPIALYSDTRFTQHLLGGIRWAAGAAD